METTFTKEMIIEAPESANQTIVNHKKSDLKDFLFGIFYIFKKFFLIG